MNREYLLSTAEMQQYDRNTIEKIGVPQMVLMERAAYAVAKEAMKYSEENDKFPCRVLIAAGSGNNGADAIAVGRILKEYDFEVDIFLGSEVKSEGAIKQKKIASFYNISFCNEIPDKDYEIIIDGLFGIGLNRELEEVQKKQIKMLNQKNGYKISIDIPSGINATDGTMYGEAFVADTTITFGFYKLGLFLQEGKKHAGMVKKANIGINKLSFNGTNPGIFTYDINTDCTLIDFFRDENGNKGTFGKVGIIAGRDNMTGAAVLASTAALRSGCGMVCAVTEKESSLIIKSNIPEVIVHSYSKKEEAELLTKKAIDWCDVIAAGPGMGTDDIACEMLKTILNTKGKTIIFDADAITILAEHKELYYKLIRRQSDLESKGIVIFTPHLMEFARLIHKDISEVKVSRYELCKEFSRVVQGIIVLKDARTIVCKENETLYLNMTGNDGMATAGSGDVLTGLISSITAQTLKRHEDVFEAVCMAVYIHGKAGEMASKLTSNSYCIASDLINQFYRLMK